MPRAGASAEKSPTAPQGACDRERPGQTKADAEEPPGAAGGARAEDLILPQELADLLGRATAARADVFRGVVDYIGAKRLYAQQEGYATLDARLKVLMGGGRQGTCCRLSRIGKRVGRLLDNSQPEAAAAAPNRAGREAAAAAASRQACGSVGEPVAVAPDRGRAGGSGAGG